MTNLEIGLAVGLFVLLLTNISLKGMARELEDRIRQLEAERRADA